MSSVAPYMILLRKILRERNMKTNNQDIKNEDKLKDKGKKPIEIAAEKLASILIAQIEFNRNKDRYQKKKPYS
jgi:hypothetical protein